MPHRCAHCNDFHVLRFSKRVLRAYKAFNDAPPNQKTAKLTALALAFVDDCSADDIDLDPDTHDTVAAVKAAVSHANDGLLRLGRDIYNMVHDSSMEETDEPDHCDHTKAPDKMN